MKIEFKRFGGWTWWKLELALLDFSFVQDKQFPAIYIPAIYVVHCKFTLQEVYQL